MRWIHNVSPAMVVAGVVLAACTGEQAAPALSAAEEQQVVAVGDSAATRLAKTLVGRLTAALEEGGPAHAIQFCSAEALPLTAEVEERTGLSIKRTSTRVRNPRNAPDSLEAAALRYFQDRLAEDGRLPSHRVQVAGPDEYRYYKPLQMAPLCVQCHGDPAVLSPEVRTALRERYPEDRAVGYEGGEFRGVIRVSVPADALPSRR